MDELLAVRCAQLPGDGALKRLGGTGAVQGVRPAGDGAPTGTQRETGDTSEGPGWFQFSPTAHAGKAA